MSFGGGGRAALVMRAAIGAGTLTCPRRSNQSVCLGAMVGMKEGS